MSQEKQPTSLGELRQSAVASRQERHPVSMSFFNMDGFELMQRIAKAFAASDLVPQQYQGNLPNCMIALDMAQRIGANPLMVMQNLYVVHGTPGWSSKFLIATVNTCGRFSSLRYEWRGEPGKPDYGCRAWAVEKDTDERLVGVWVDWAMVNAEGWASKSGSKWKTMADQMFIYRAAAFWQRAYAPDLAMGLQTAEELGDVYDARQSGDGAYTVDINDLRSGTTQEAREVPGEVVDTTTGEIKPEPAKKERKPRKQNDAEVIDTAPSQNDTPTDADQEPETGQEAGALDGLNWD